MLNFKTLLLGPLCAFVVAAAPAPKPPAPPLEKGEALVLEGPDGVVYRFGDSHRESPMGSLAGLVWLKLEGADWSSVGVRFKCLGLMNGEACSLAKGHGKVDVSGALRAGCDLAILTWARMSVLEWRKDYGDGAGRVHLQEGFAPFLGQRMPPGDGLPAITGAWVGDGNLLRVSPDSMLDWLMDPEQDALLRQARRLLLNVIKETYDEHAWWVMVGTAQVPAELGVTSAWAVGGNGLVLAVLRLPGGKGRAEALARFRLLLAIPGK